jgi:prevent-host-death family protein
MASALEDLLEPREVRLRGEHSTITKREARENFALVMMHASNSKDVVITNHGRPQAAIISIDRYAILDFLEATGIAEFVQGLAKTDLDEKQLRDALITELSKR